MGATERPAGGRRVAVLGSGPVGLDAALAALDAGYEVSVYEASSHPADNVRAWGHVRMFSPWGMNLSPRMRERLGGSGVEMALDGPDAPTGAQLRERVLLPLWSRPPLASFLRLGSRVVAVGREGLLKHEEIGAPERGRRAFRILIQDAAGRERVEHADIVLDCTGKYGNPNTLGEAGIPAPGERTLAGRIKRSIPDLREGSGEWSGRTILLAGSGHSAQTAVRDLAELATTHPGTRVLWLLRKSRPEWGSTEEDPLPGRRRLAEAAEALAGGASPAVEVVPGSVVDGLEPENGGVRVRLREGGRSGKEVKVNRILSLTGGVGDHTLYRQLQVHECYATSGPMNLSAALLGAEGVDCLTQESHGVESLRNPEPNFFILGDKSYGRNSTFLLRIGWQQVDDVFRELGPAG